MAELLKIEKHYSDETVVVIKKGFVAELTVDKETSNVNSALVEEDQSMVFLAAIQLADNLGMFN